VAQMRYEYDRAVEQLKEGRTGLEQYRGLVERVTRQVSANKSHVQKLEAETKAYLKAGDRATASKFALELQKAKEELATNDNQLQMHETAYGNNLKKIQHANEKLIELREKITKYDAELKMSAAEAEIAKLSETFNVNLTTDFGEIESVIQQRIDQNRGKVRVAADLSEKGIAEIKAEERMQGQLAEQATVFQHDGDPMLHEVMRRCSADVGAVLDDATRLRTQKAANRPHQRALPRAVGADDRHRLAVAD